MVSLSAAAVSGSGCVGGATVGAAAGAAVGPERGCTGSGRDGAGGAAVPSEARGATAPPGCTRVPQWLGGAGAVATAPCAGDGTEIDSDCDFAGEGGPPGTGMGAGAMIGPGGVMADAPGTSGG